MTAAEAKEINAALKLLTEAIHQQSVKIGALEQQVANEAQLCPYREIIASVKTNSEKCITNGARIDHVEDKLHVLEVQITKAGMLSGAAGGGVFSAVGMLAFAVGKAAGWW